MTVPAAEVEADAEKANDARTAPVLVWQMLENMSKEELLEWRKSEPKNRASIEERNLDIGFPYGWYPAMLSADLEVGQVKPLRYFSTDLVIWRGEDGEVRMLDAYCRHLGAHMGYGGKVTGNNLECPFHSWQYNGEGIVESIPYAKRIPPQVKRPCEKQWHVTEANRWIWFWYHPTGAAPMWEVEHIPEATDPEWTDYEMFEWDVWGSLQNMAENGVDSAHFKYIHGAADMPDYEFDWGTGDHQRGARLFLNLGTPRGMVKGEIAYRNIGPGQSYTRFTGICETLLVACITPIDEDHVVSRFCFTQPKAQKEGPAAGAARAIIKDICKQFDQDKVVWDRQRYLPNALVCDGDGPIGKFRSWYKQFYVKDAASTEA